MNENSTYKVIAKFQQTYLIEQHTNTPRNKELELKLEFEWSRQASGIEAVLIC